MPNDFDEDELAGLSEDERAALATDDDEADILKSIAGDDGDDGDDGEAGGDDQGDDDDNAGAEQIEQQGDDNVRSGDAAQSSGSAADAGKQDGTSAKPGNDIPAAAAQSEFLPTFTAEAPADLDAKLAEIDERAKSLAQKFEDGEISTAEFVEQSQAMTDDRLHLRMASEQARWTAAQNEAVRAQRWQWELERFYGSKAGEAYKDPIMAAALSASVKQLDADPANAKRSDGWFLEEADRQVRSRMNLGEQSAKSEKQIKAEERRPDLTVAPKTLANLPAAELADTGADEFAYLDKLLDKDPMAYEAALRKLTPEQESRYLGVSS